MRYMGGKGRIAKQLAAVILESTDDRSRYIEPFLGGGGMAAQMGQHFDTAHYSDAHPDLVLMWQAAGDGWTPPADVTEQEYQELRHAAPSAVRGFVGMGGSFGGKWFGGYARGGFNADGTPRNHQAESSRAVIKDAAAMRAQRQTVIEQRDALTIDARPGDVIYCDPPYAGTTGYAEGLDHAAFWQAAQAWAETGASVFVSEYAAPPGWICIWEKPLRSSVRVGSQDRHTAVERLFTWGGVPALAMAA